MVLAVLLLLLAGKSVQADTPTAEAPSSGPGPFISNLTDAPLPRPVAGQDLRISALLTPQNGPVASATLFYIVNFDAPEGSLPMTANAVTGAYSAVIPAASFVAGDMVRWYVEAEDNAAQQSREPAYKHPDDPKYLGTVITPEPLNFTTTLPVLEWWTQNPEQAISTGGANGSALYFLDRFYDNVQSERKGVTSLNTPKPKLKFSLNKKIFVYKKDLDVAANEKPVDEFDLVSLYIEPGQKSYMREHTAYEVLREAGAPYAYNFYTVVRQNNAFWGLFLYVEHDDNSYLERNGFDKNGFFFKPTSGTKANLAWDIPENQLQYYFKRQNKKSTDSWSQLADLSQGIAGGTNELRSDWVFDNINLPVTINQLTVLTMLLTQDRCTKNWFVYQAPESDGSIWSMLPYDLKSALGADAGLNGTPAPDYCILECEQWNSPLYCDRNHYQDLNGNQTAPWNTIIATNPFNSGRRLAQAAAAAAGPTPADIAAAPYNADLTQEGPTITGAPGTFNYLVDLILDVSATRQMYMRRLRTLMDFFLGGKLEQIITQTYQQIKTAADADNLIWQIGSIDDGYQALVTQQLPPRKQQLYDTYGPTGAAPLVPDAQQANAGLILGRTGSDASPAQQFVELLNPNAFAVDVSGWSVSGDVTMTLAKGTVIAGPSSLLLVPGVPGFRSRTNSPMQGEGLQLQGNYTGTLTANGVVTLADDTGREVFSSPVSNEPIPATAG